MDFTDKLGRREFIGGAAATEIAMLTKNARGHVVDCDLAFVAASIEAGNSLDRIEDTLLELIISHARDYAEKHKIRNCIVGYTAATAAHTTVIVDTKEKVLAVFKDAEVLTGKPVTDARAGIFVSGKGVLIGDAASAAYNSLESTIKELSITQL
jgi:hypothetical protein